MLSEEQGAGCTGHCCVGRRGAATLLLCIRGWTRMDAGDLSARRTTDQSFEDSPAPLLWLYLWRAETAATHVLSAQWPDRSVMAAAHCTRHVRFLPVRVHRCAGAGDCRVHALVSHHMCIAVGHDTRHTTSISILNLSAPCMNVVKIIDMERKDDALRSGDPWPSPWPHLPIGSIVYLPIECTSRVLGAASEGGGRSAMTMGEA